MCLWSLYWKLQKSGERNQRPKQIGDLPCSWVKSLDVAMMSIPHQLFYRFYAILMLQWDIFCTNWEAGSKIYIEKKSKEL